MTYDAETDELVFSTGRKIRAHGMQLAPSRMPSGEPHYETSPDGVTYGYDGRVDETDDLTLVERRELAEQMAAYWRAWAEMECCDARADETLYGVKACVRVRGHAGEHRFIWREP